MKRKTVRGKTLNKARLLSDGIKFRLKKIEEFEKKELKGGTAKQQKQLQLHIRSNRTHKYKRA